MSIRLLTCTLALAVVAPLTFGDLASSQGDPPSEKPARKLGDILDDPTEGQIPRVTGREAAKGVEVQINQIDASKFPQVGIFATVLREGEPVPGLAYKDFQVREDEVDQEPLTVVPKLTPLSVVLTLDTSGSMKKRLTDAQAAAKSFLDTLKPEDKAQVIRFSRDVKTIHPLGADRSRAKEAIDGTVARGDTALWDALYVSVDSLRDVSGRKAIVLLSDGVDDDGTGKPLSTRGVGDVLTLARQVNVPIYAIGLGTELDEANLKKVGKESGALYLNAVEPAELKQLYDNIGKQLAGQYSIHYTSNLPADGTEHRVQMKVADGTSTKAYQAPVKVAAAPAAPAPVVREVVKSSICPKDFMAFRGKREPLICDCSEEAIKRTGGVWGMDVYWEDSSICKAAMHAGVIESSGGKVTVVPLPGEDSYAGVERNGVDSRNWSKGKGSFGFGK